MSNRLHVVPVDDLLEHVETGSCWCEGRIELLDGVEIVIHQSADGREETEAVVGRLEGEITREMERLWAKLLMQRAPS